MNSQIAKDIQIIASNLEGVVNFSSISWSQSLICKKGESINDLLFIKKIRGIYFYTSRSSMELICFLKRKNEFPCYVVCENSNEVYELK